MQSSDVLYTAPLTARLYSSWHVTDACNASGVTIGCETIKCRYLSTGRRPPLARVARPAAGQHVTVAWRGAADTFDSYWEARILGVNEAYGTARVRWLFDSDDSTVRLSEVHELPASVVAERSASRNPRW